MGCQRLIILQLILCSGCIPWSLPSTADNDVEADSDGDADGDVDADSDTDGDVDADSDIDRDVDSNGDIDSDAESDDDERCVPTLDPAIAEALESSGCSDLEDATYDLNVDPGPTTWELSFNELCRPDSEQFDTGPISSCKIFINEREICVVLLRSLDVPTGSRLIVSDERPVILMSANSVRLNGDLDVSARGDVAGPGGGRGGIRGDSILDFGRDGAHPNGVDPGGLQGDNYCGGGGGGGNLVGGGAATCPVGDSGGEGALSHGRCHQEDILDTFGGSGGGGGRESGIVGAWFGGNGGGGGGFILIFALTTIDIGYDGAVLAMGADGGDVTTSTEEIGGAAGGGGGGGGTVVLEASQITVIGFVNVDGGSGSNGEFEYDNVPGTAAGGPPNFGEGASDSACVQTAESAVWVSGGGGGGVGQIFLRTCTGRLEWLDRPEWLCPPMNF